MDSFSSRSGIAGFHPGRWVCLEGGKDCNILAVGSMVREACEICEILKKNGIHAGVWNCSSVKPLDIETLREVSCKPYYTLEEHMLNGGFGSYILRTCSELHILPPKACFGIHDQYITHGNHAQLVKDAGLDTETVADRILTISGRKTSDE